MSALKDTLNVFTRAPQLILPTRFISRTAYRPFGHSTCDEISPESVMLDMGLIVLYLVCLRESVSIYWSPVMEAIDLSGALPGFGKAA